jgi:hypothetical protein
MSTLTTDRTMWLCEATPVSRQTNAASEDSLAITSQEREHAQRAWDNCVNSKLIEWGRDPAQLEEEELIPPTRDAIASAVRIAIYFRDQGIVAPDRVVPDGDGGIVLERWSGPFSESFEISSDGRIEYVSCWDRRVVERLPIQIR